MSEHTNTGNCFSMNMLYQQCSCERDLCERCHEHDQSRGDCVTCESCSVCEERKRNANEVERQLWKKACDNAKECHADAERLVAKVKEIVIGGTDKRNNMAIMATYAALYAAQGTMYALMTFGHLAARFTRECEKEAAE